jgi:hypothetical protein
MDLCESAGVDDSIGYVEEETADRGDGGRGSQGEDRRVNNTTSIGRRSTSRRSTRGSATIDTVGQLKPRDREITHQSVRRYCEGCGIEDRRVNSHLDIPCVERIHRVDLDSEKDVSSNSLSTINVTGADVEDIRVCRLGRRSRKRAR